MDWFIETLLIVGLIFISAYSIKVNQEAVQAMNTMNKQIQMMFVKSQETKMKFTEERLKLQLAINWARYDRGQIEYFEYCRRCDMTWAKYFRDNLTK